LGNSFKPVAYTKFCTSCEIVKPISDFYEVKGRAVQPCKACKCAVSSERNKSDGYAKNKEAAKKWRANNTAHLQEYYRKKRDAKAEKE